MITMPDLQTALLDILHELRGTGIKLIIGGGYGIFLKTDYVRRNDLRTLLDEWPEPRSTNDLDLYLRPELLIESDFLQPLRKAIDKLGYNVINSARNYQFAKPGPTGGREGSIKIDILTGPQSLFDGTVAKVDDHRVKPRPRVGIHAHPTDEAITLEDGLIPVEVKGVLGTGDEWEDEVFLPHPYTFLTMKLFAFRDRMEDEIKDLGRHHALDLYTVLATTTEAEWDFAKNLRDAHSKNPYAIEASRIVSDHFSGTTVLGIIRLKENHYYRPELQLDEFMSALKELFPEPARATPSKK
jgi:hypothetical protein